LAGTLGGHSLTILIGESSQASEAHHALLGVQAYS
jgi:hypothetical protein